ncbi:glycosyltransferase family 2 protein [Labrys wisconsinensis]|uniref:Cellulose synthase/poly-beta-1,6-N-acetylglucosamine synthase-like glycosyltransferase n=1 Tax=Labrys wisconsinensis TaxID=425677 RepID=A0ABU0IZ25_9HYPH|nr:glycosyltransferase family 2 protein [Labrys wisconsinensis]MDQ0467262.1 cellulose synthase/poly-beta-1,6-N-acetylglucosamine synthase-like glycosyltransferase [Labrys wisconsinensis]
MSIVFVILAWTGLALAALSVVGWAVTFGSTVATLCLLGLHWRLRRAGLADEAARLARPLPPDPDLPDVVVQIPTFNEGTMVARALAAATALDWPQDKLHIQVLDDSTDDSVAIARAEVEACRARGFDVALIHRTDRSEFKAGALANAMGLTPHGYFAILDVDYVPAPDFLRRTMACLLAEPQLGFIQARFDYLNADANALTRAQAVLLDAHLAIEQATRSWAGHPLPFNGTCGVWRREAIEQAGGWHGDTLAEDLDLSYRAWRLGWRGRFLMTVPVPGELPDTMPVWKTQQRRWAKGFGEVTIRTLGPILADRTLPLRTRLAVLLHLGVWWSGPSWALALPTGVVAIVLNPSLFGSLGLLLIAQLVVGYVMLFAFLWAGRRSLRPAAARLGRFLGDFVGVSRKLSALGGTVGAAQREAIFRKRSDFVRTPKNAIRNPGSPGDAHAPQPGPP